MKTVLITRPLNLAEQFADKVQAHHYQTVIFPTIEVKPVAFDSDINLNQFNMIIFISPAAIIAFHTKIQTLPYHLKIFTIGGDSAALVKKYGWPDAIHPYLHFSREGLLNLPELQNISQQPILIVEGKNSNHLLANALTSRGAQVSQLAVYERVLPQPKQLPNLEAIDIIISTSEESMKNLVQLLGPHVKTKTLLVSSQRLADVAKTLGFIEEPLLARNAGDEALIQALPT